LGQLALSGQHPSPFSQLAAFLHSPAFWVHSFWHWALSWSAVFCWQQDMAVNMVTARIKSFFIIFLCVNGYLIGYSSLSPPLAAV
jgi:hypothetical protein